jgi:UDP-GlcNAc:undecaprenyl-phosphate/decaprenyl-phosphate GlcNAc-1-phosphate transferase
MSAYLLLLLACCTTGCALAVLERAAPSLRLLDLPSGHKTHKAPTPVVGGLAIALVLFLFGLTGNLGPVPAPLYGGIAAAALLGLVDDVRPLGAKVKLLLMLGIFTLTLPQSDTVLQSLGMLLPGVSVPLGRLALPFTLFAAVGVINAFNLIDGMDGLAGTVAMCALGGYLVIATLIGATDWVPFLTVVIAATAAFLGFNLRLPGRRRARLFLGDAGSLVLGFILLWISVDLSQRPGGAPPIVMVWLLALPILDTLATMLLRIREGTSVLSPGHDHFHHLLRAYGVSVERTVLLAGVLSIGFAAMGLLMWQARIPEWLSAALFLLSAAAYLWAHLYAWTRLGRGKQIAHHRKPSPGHPGGR